MVCRPTDAGGLGFGLKGDMGWMHDILEDFKKDPIHRRHHHQWLTFRLLYAFQENFQLPLSHDEVVHGKGSLLGRMPGDAWQKFANLRLLLACLYAQPGKKLLFMGGEFGQGLDCHLLSSAPHAGVQNLVTALNRLHSSEPALHELDCEPAGFEWVDCNDAAASTLSFLRRDRSGGAILAVFNFTPVPRRGYRVGVPSGGVWRELLNSDAKEFGGSGIGNLGVSRASAEPWQGRPNSLKLVLPPLAAVFLKG
jgi:1,4-alpha-glucan branching enzyme